MKSGWGKQIRYFGIGSSEQTDHFAGHSKKTKKKFDRTNELYRH
jgi:hypothetical protein